MPKRIKDLRQKILETAQELFNNASYSQVDTRKISKSVGIAAGTLYNYFPTKKALFLAVVEKSWVESMRRLESTLEDVSEATDIIDIFLDALYAEFKRNKRLGRSFFQLTVTEQVKRADDCVDMKTGPLREIAETLSDVFVRALSQYTGRPIQAEDEQTVRRLVLLLHLAIPVMENVYNDTAQENLRFLSQMLHAYVDTYITSARKMHG